MIIIIWVLLSLILSNGYATSDSMDYVNFSNIKKVLENDMLNKEVSKKKKKHQLERRRKRKSIVQKYNIPKDQDFWPFISEYWIVKNNARLKWDFKKPEYGIEQDFAKLLQDIGVFHVKFKILLLNTKDVTHFALPSGKDEYIFLLSLPFIKDLDLSKLEISIILFEDYLRSKAMYFKEYVSITGTKETLGGNFYKKKLNKGLFRNILNKYDDIVFRTGFTFKHQFEITKQMVNALQSKPKLIKVYNNMLDKVDSLIKGNKAYINHIKIYPSPELQMGWIKSSTNGL